MKAKKDNWKQNKEKIENLVDVLHRIFITSDEAGNYYYKHFV